jgi:predicted transcriptional regulator YdeE/DNA-binding transcriptional MerR regulator
MLGRPSKMHHAQSEQVDMLKIGQFARLGRVPVKTLRYYDEIGLLRPSGVDRWTRYRYYTAEQLPALERIVMFKRLGFSLEDVAFLLRNDLPRPDLAGMLKARRTALRQEIQTAEAQLAQIDAWLDQAEHAPEAQKETEMQPSNFVTMDRFLVVGMPYLGKNENREIPAMWGTFMQRQREIKHVAPSPHGNYGICRANSQGLVDYIAALPVTSLDDVPEGMIGYEVPQQTYAVFEAHGLIDIPATFDHILHAWLPSSGYEWGNGPDFEYYAPEWENSESTVYIYFPVKKR